ncbi:MAG: Spy/CpxP family protein refolding chaperone [Bacteroidetes bacterium]|nr:Spy/CpxP family protein refolding chaperone [Bacteroidota bacterium]
MKTKQIFSIILLMLIGMQISSFAQDAKMKEQPLVNHPYQQGQGEMKNLPPLPPLPPPVLPGIPNLTKEQSEKIKKLQLELALNKFPLENIVREKEAGLQTISTVKSPDMKAIEKQIEEIGAIKIQLAKLQASHDQDIRKILDDEQRLIFDKRPPMHEPRPF